MVSIRPFPFFSGYLWEKTLKTCPPPCPKRLNCSLVLAQCRIILLHNTLKLFHQLPVFVFKFKAKLFVSFLPGGKGVVRLTLEYATRMGHSQSCKNFQPTGVAKVFSSLGVVKLAVLYPRNKRLRDARPTFCETVIMPPSWPRICFSQGDAVSEFMQWQAALRRAGTAA